MPPGVPDQCYAGTPTPAVIWSRCQIPPLRPPTSPPRSKQHSWVIVCLHKLLSAFHAATPSYLRIVLIWLHHSSSHHPITAHICCECLPHVRVFTSLALIVQRSVVTHSFHFIHFHNILSVCSPHHHTMSDKRPQLQSHVCFPGQHGLVFSSHKADCQEGKTVFYYNIIQIVFQLKLMHFVLLHDFIVIIIIHHLIYRLKCWHWYLIF